MALLDLIHSNDDMLYREADLVGLPGVFLNQKIADMYHSMYHYKGLGLSAPQVGVGMKLAVMDVNGEKLTLINPEILERSEKIVDSTEGCLSHPGEETTIQRHKEIVVKTYDPQGNSTIHKLTGLAAIVAQHEIDHLNGITIKNRKPLVRKV